ncbi:GTP-binding protein [Rickettsiella endosymbiont of Miltochrista miniata]|uniref:GTP-binding protein n=1 Tax=Rickettsiella endosymbiont of Miltochrista miniata TaxID=3066239 RepID=UPI00313F1837
MPNHSDNKCKIILVGKLRVGKSSLVRRLIGLGFSYNYEPTIFNDLALLQKESIRLYLWEFSGDEKFTTLSKLYYKSASIIIYALDSTKNTEENKRIFLEFKEEISSILPISDCFQMIVFTKSDDKDSKLSQDYLKEFDTFNVPTIVCSAKENKGITEVKDTLFNFSQFSPIKKMEEESLISAIERHSKTLSKKHSQLSKNKSTALEAIAKACRDGGMGQHRSQTNVRCLSIEKIPKIKAIIGEKKGIVGQHRHWSIFNWFFNLLDPSFLEHRVTSNELVNKLDVYLKHSTDNLESIRPTNH